VAWIIFKNRPVGALRQYFNLGNISIITILSPGSSTTSDKFSSLSTLKAVNPAVWRCGDRFLLLVVNMNTRRFFCLFFRLSTTSFRPGKAYFFNRVSLIKEFEANGSANERLEPKEAVVSKQLIILR
jgi:hypothetical protein